ncbi:hypothetical protein LTR36_002350 [Oleoguttula mirabilis]|uniref:ZW10 C-terminal helical domain-containing protein n=1 Tax=Oleoguttula mirabilis TaxID=1507867 RepID=A0AAV9JLQ3_9PEZI|nr:hypothetical protein LTR36_002350 [Oleoguttula mirabilis]
MATADPIPPAILQYISHNTYPDSESVFSSTLTTPSISTLLQELHAAQDDVKNDIRTLSKATAPDIDTWISRAQALQADILHSRDTARAIVAEHEEGRQLKVQVEDAASKVALLEREVGFEETLSGTLEHIRYANGVLDAVQDEAVKGNVEAALERLETAQESIDGLDDVRETRACGLLQGRVKQLRDSLAETATEFWNALLDVRVEEKIVAVKRGGGLSSYVPDAAADLLETDLEDLVMAAQVLGIFDGLVLTLSRDVERAVVRPRLLVDEDGQVVKVIFNAAELSCAGKSDDTSLAALLKDLETIVTFLATHLPASISLPLSDLLIPALSTRLEDHWLEPAVPLDISEMPAFQDTLARVQHLADHIDKCSLRGTKHLHDWVEGAPRTWLTKRREAVLGEVRNLVFAGLGETEVVERVETRMVAREDHAALGGGAIEEGGEEEWDSAWEEPAEEEKEIPVEGRHGSSIVAAADGAEEDDESSAWDTNDPDDKPANEAAGDEEGEGDAWGWGDDEKAAASPVATKPTSQSSSAKPNGTTPTPTPTKPAEREMTLRETFTVTAIPSGILTIIQTLIADAQTLAGSAYASSPIAPAATGLYTLPTLALAIYRATALTAYTTKLAATGNMLIYNDASHLSSLLRDWQNGEPEKSRLRLDGDVKALETFAKRAYSAEMESQRTILKDLLDGAGGFGNVTKPPFKAECESAVEQTVDRLREVGKLWKGVLSDGALLQSLGSLLATVTGKMIAEIVDLGDIGEEDSHQLRKLMDVVSAAKDLFVQQGGGQDMTFIYCPNWLKFQYLAEILESSLADIRYLWSEGELSLEFEAEEVVELIEGLFAESEMRRRAIGEVRRGGRR